MNRREFLKLSGQGAIALGLLKGGCIGSKPLAGLAGIAEVGTDYLVFDGQGRTYRLLPPQHKVQRLDAGGALVWEIGGLGETDGLFNYPIGMEVDSEGHAYVVDQGNSRIKVFDAQGSYLRQIGGRSGDADDDPAELDFPRHLALDAEGRVYICDTRDHHIQVFDKEGDAIDEIGEFGDGAGHLNHPVALAVDAQGNLHVVDAGNARIQVYDAAGNHVRSYGGYGSEEGGLLTPRSILIDARGNCYVADTAGAHLDVFGPDGSVREVITPLFADGTPASPLHLAWAPDGGIYVTALPTVV